MEKEINMIAACPKCRARYRIEAGRLQPKGVRLRCSQCDAVFRVTPPVTPQRQVVENSSARPPAPPDAEPPRGSGPVIVVADSDIDAGKRTAQVLAEWGYAPVLVHDGVEAILNIQRQMPQAVVLDAGLSKMFGFQVCELMKRNESLSSIHVVLIGAIHDETRYRREPSELYGADAYLERPQLPEALRAILRGFGLLGGAAPPATSAPTPGPMRTPVPDSRPEPVPAPALVPTPEPAPPALEPAPLPTVTEAEQSEEYAAARRLARIIVSDIVLYNAEKFDAGVRSGDVAGALAGELEEARALLAQRVSARLRDECDFVTDELVRVAQARGMSG
jgi:predicted Zn finger-like uncharacterized protein